MVRVISHWDGESYKNRSSKGARRKSASDQEPWSIAPLPIASDFSLLASSDGELSFHELLGLSGNLYHLIRTGHSAPQYRLRFR